MVTVVISDDLMALLDEYKSVSARLRQSDGIFGDKIDRYLKERFDNEGQYVGPEDKRANACIYKKLIEEARLVEMENAKWTLDLLVKDMVVLSSEE